MGAPLAGGGDSFAVPDAAELGFGRLFEQTNDAIVVSTSDGRIVLWNPAAERMFGYPRGDALGMAVDMIVPEHLRGAHRVGMDEFRRTGHGRVIDKGRPLELPALHRDGHQFYIDLTLSRIEQHGEHYVLAIIRDVDERVRLREEAARRQRELEAANESLEAFSFVIGHDLKEPVRAMATYLEEAQRAPTFEEQRAHVAAAAEAQKNMQRLLMGLLEWSRTTMTPVEPEVLRIDQVLRTPECAAQFQDLARERRALLEISPDIPPVLATESLVCRVFGNLITNAIKHNPRPDPRIRISAGASAPRNRVEILVDDNGPGFPEEMKARVRRFKHRPTTLKGGFGLSITHRAVERLGGELYLDDAPGGGGRARVHLPKPVLVPRSTLEERVRELV